MATPTSKEIMDFSPFNKGGKEELPQFKRRLYRELEKTDRLGLITAITGLRRVGKTVLLKQILAKKGGAYFSFDEQRYHNTESLSAVIETFLEHGFKTIVLDEVGNIGDWSGTLKKYYDRGGTKFYVSGSSSLKIKKGRESLAGRMFDFRLPPFQFDEYLEKAGMPQADSLWGMKRRQEELSEFLESGSFPEMHGRGSAAAKKYIQSMADKVVYEDIPARFRIEYRSKLADLLKYCATFSSSLFSEASLSSMLGLNRGTVSDYLSYLSQSYLSSIILEEGSYARALQKSRKLFVACPSLYWGLSDSFSEGVSAEVAVFDRLTAWGIEPKFYRDYSKREVDFIANGIPIEVKNRGFISEQDCSAILHYLEKKRLDFGIMVTKDKFDVKKTGKARILLVPLSVFLSARDFGAMLKP